MENNLKKEKKKHDHKLTKLLKVSIFSIVMLAPFISVTSTCAYMAFNKNAELPPQQQEIIVEKEYNTNEISSENDIKFGNIYLYNNGTNISTDHIWFGDIEIISYTDMYIVNGNLEDIDENILIEDIIGAYFIMRGYNNFNDINIEISNYLPIYYTTEYQTIYDNSNAFYYAVDQLQESELFNWTQNTAIYNGIYGLTNGMGNNNPTMAILLTYWTITTCIYVIFDIVIELFTRLTHLIGER